MKKHNNTIFNSILLLLGMSSFLYFILLLSTISFSKDLLIYPIFSLITIGFGLYELRTKTSVLSKLPKWVQYILLFFVTSVVILFISVELLLVNQSLNSYQQASDYTIVLGAQIRGTSLTPSLQFRLDAALSYYQEHPTTTLVVSGGQGPGEDDSEANVMKQYLVANGIPEHKILVEDQSTSTYENLIFSKKILDANTYRPYDVTIITNNFHCYRAQYIAENIGLNAHTYASPGHMISTPHYYIREFFALTKEIIHFL